MVKKNKSAFALLKEKKQEGTITSKELKQYNALKKEKRQKKAEQSRLNGSQLSLDLSVAESPKKRKKKKAPAPDTPTKSVTDVKLESPKKAEKTEKNPPTSSETPTKNVPDVKLATPKKKRKKNPSVSETPTKCVLASQEFPLSPGSPLISSTEIPSGQTPAKIRPTPDTPTKSEAESDVELHPQTDVELDPQTDVELHPQTEALKEIIISQYKAMQAMMAVMAETRRKAALHGVTLSDLEPVKLARPLKGGKGQRPKKMNSFYVWCLEHDQAGLTKEEKKERWATVSDEDKKALSKKAREMNKESGWVPGKKSNSNVARKISAYSAFTSLKISEDKLKMVEVGALWKTLTGAEKEEYQKIADNKNRKMVKLHDPEKNVILNTASTEELSEDEEE